MKNHLIRINAPRTWTIARKVKKFVARPNPGAHSLDESYPLGTIMKEMLGIANTTKEARYILNQGHVFVDQKKVKVLNYSVGLFDVISFPHTNENYRLLLNNKNKLVLIKIDDKESKIKPVKILNKTVLNKKFQINTTGGRNFLLEKNSYKVGDTLVIELPSQKIIDHIPLEKGNMVYMTKGSHVGAIGKVEAIEKDHITIKIGNQTTKTMKKYAFVIGKDKTAIKFT